MLNNNQAVKIDPRLLPDDESAIRDFEANGGQLTVFSCFGEDPLWGEILPCLLKEKLSFTDDSQIFLTFFTQW